MRSLSLIRMCALGVLGVAVSTSVALKLGSGHHAEYIVPKWLFYVLTIIELVSVPLLFSRFVRITLMCMVVLFAGGIVITIASGGRSCGCFGAYSALASNQQKILINSALGIIASGLLFRRSERGAE